MSVGLRASIKKDPRELILLLCAHELILGGGKALPGPNQAATPVRLETTRTVLSQQPHLRGWCAAQPLPHAHLPLGLSLGTGWSLFEMPFLGSACLRFLLGDLDFISSVSWYSVSPAS